MLAIATDPSGYWSAVFDAVVAENDGEPRVIPGAVALFERDGGVEWKHADNTRRSRELVLAYWSQPGNYEYGFEWVFHLDGTLEMRAQLTGIMAAKGVADGAHDPYSHLVAPNLAAPHHEHFFAFRLDMDVDGPSNRVMELNTVAMPAGPKNPYGGGFTMEESPLRMERDAVGARYEALVRAFGAAHGREVDALRAGLRAC